MKSKYLRSVDTTLIPVPTDESLKDDPGELKLSSTELKDYINNIKNKIFLLFKAFLKNKSMFISFFH